MQVSSRVCGFCCAAASGGSVNQLFRLLPLLLLLPPGAATNALVDRVAIGGSRNVVHCCCCACCCGTGGHCQHLATDSTHPHPYTDATPWSADHLRSHTRCLSTDPRPPPHPFLQTPPIAS